MQKTAIPDPMEYYTIDFEDGARLNIAGKNLFDAIISVAPKYKLKKRRIKITKIYKQTDTKPALIFDLEKWGMEIFFNPPLKFNNHA